MPVPDPIRILLVDDHQFIREAVAQLINLQSDMRVVGEAADGPEAIELYDRLAPDIALIDLRMRQMNGIETLTAIRRKHPHAQIVILSAYKFQEDVEQSLSAGACAYVTKDSMQQEVLQVIRQVCSDREQD